MREDDLSDVLPLPAEIRHHHRAIRKRLETGITDVVQEAIDAYPKRTEIRIFASDMI